jgi:hypothetical protein
VGLNNFDGTISPPTGIHSLTAGFFTITDTNTSTGCVGIKLTDTSSSQDFKYVLNNTDSGFPAPATQAWQSGTHGATGVTIAGANTGENVFQAVLDDGTSVITGIVGNFTFPTNMCRDLGGAGGA